MKCTCLFCFLIFINLNGISQIPEDTSFYPLAISCKLSENQSEKLLKIIDIIITNTSDTVYEFNLNWCPVFKHQYPIQFLPDITTREIIGCDGNKNTSIKLSPKGSYSHSIAIICPDSLKGKRIKLKGGLRFIKKNTVPLDLSSLDEKTMEKIAQWASKLKYDWIWCKPFYIKFY